MNDVKATFYKTINTIVATDRIDNEEAYIINDYISRLEASIMNEQKENEKLKNRIHALEKHNQKLQLEAQRYFDLLMECEYGGDKE